VLRSQSKNASQNEAGHYFGVTPNLREADICQS